MPRLIKRRKLTRPPDRPGYSPAEMEVIHLLISLAVFTFMSYFLSKIVVNNRKLRMLAGGTPSVIIEGGKVL